MNDVEKGTYAVTNDGIKKLIVVKSFLIKKYLTMLWNCKLIRLCHYIRRTQSISMREAVINTIVHSDFLREIPPVFEIFSDRMVFTSYGGLIPPCIQREFNSLF